MKKTSSVNKVAIHFGFPREFTTFQVRLAAFRSLYLYVRK